MAVKEQYTVTIDCDEPLCMASKRFIAPEEHPVSALFAVECREFMQQEGWRFMFGRVFCPAHKQMGGVRPGRTKRRKGDTYGEGDGAGITAGPGAGSGLCLFEL